ncbi:flagellar protein [Tabrizicola sp. WMC-M-20]|nr:flagellar protein [Tabrizicola sp. WMC-M-20]
MSSILTNTSAMNALTALRSVNSNLETTQNRISTGLKINSAKDNAAYFSISETMNSDSAMYKAIDEGLTLTKNSVATARLGSETVTDLAKQFVERVAFAQGDAVDRVAIQAELTALSERIATTVQQSTFNGNDLVTGGAAVTVVTGISRATGALTTTNMTFDPVDLGAIGTALGAIDITAATDAAAMAAILVSADAQLTAAIEASTSLGVAEKSIETQQEFLAKLTDNIDSGVGAMIDADMEQEAARLQALQVQQQLATQSLSIANQAPQNLLSLFR